MRYLRANKIFLGKGRNIYYDNFPSKEKPMDEIQELTKHMATNKFSVNKNNVLNLQGGDEFDLDQRELPLDMIFSKYHLFIAY